MIELRVVAMIRDKLTYKLSRYDKCHSSVFSINVVNNPGKNFKTSQWINVMWKIQKVDSRKFIYFTNN